MNHCHLLKRKRSMESSLWLPWSEEMLTGQYFSLLHCEQRQNQYRKLDHVGSFWQYVYPLLDNNLPMLDFFTWYFSIEQVLHQLCLYCKFWHTLLHHHIICSCILVYPETIKVLKLLPLFPGSQQNVPYQQCISWKVINSLVCIT